MVVNIWLHTRYIFKTIIQIRGRQQFIQGFVLWNVNLCDFYNKLNIITTSITRWL